jgi:hypothetical protein
MLFSQEGSSNETIVLTKLNARLRGPLVTVPVSLTPSMTDERKMYSGVPSGSDFRRGPTDE